MKNVDSCVHQRCDSSAESLHSDGDLRFGYYWQSVEYDRLVASHASVESVCILLSRLVVGGSRGDSFWIDDKINGRMGCGSLRDDQLAVQSENLCSVRLSNDRRWLVGLRCRWSLVFVESKCSTTSNKYPEECSSRFGRHDRLLRDSEWSVVVLLRSESDRDTGSMFWLYGDLSFVHGFILYVRNDRCSFHLDASVRFVDHEKYSSSTEPSSHREHFCASSEQCINAADRSTSSTDRTKSIQDALRPGPLPDSLHGSLHNLPDLFELRSGISSEIRYTSRSRTAAVQSLHEPDVSSQRHAILYLHVMRRKSVSCWTLECDQRFLQEDQMLVERVDTIRFDWISLNTMFVSLDNCLLTVTLVLFEHASNPLSSLFTSHLSSSSSPWHWHRSPAGLTFFLSIARTHSSLFVSRCSKLK